MKILKELVLLLLFLKTSLSQNTFCVTFDGEEKYKVLSEGCDDVLYVALAKYEIGLDSKGFDILAINTNSIFSDEIQSYGAGFLEGVITEERIYQHYLNSKDDIAYDERVEKFFADQESWVYEQYKNNKQDPIIYNAFLLRRQLQGIKDGYNSVAENKLSDYEINLLASNAEFEDVIDKYSEKLNFAKMNDEDFMENFLKRTHCSSVWKLKDDLSDIMYAHNTWSPYNLMVRIFKEYKFNFNHPSIKSKNIIMSSYPATLSSVDDIYAMSNQLVVIETTNIFYNNSLYDYIVPESLLTWERAMIANRLAETGSDWSDIFSQYNSGTYNNQYMILDKKLVNLEKHEIKEGAFYIVEQIPGLCRKNDVTDILKFGYWPSYNTPFDKEIIKISRIQETIEENPSRKSSIDYDLCARAKIFRRDQSNVKTLDDLKTLIRSNNYKTDPFAEGSPSNQLSCRHELTGKSCFGAYDAKVGQISDVTNTTIKMHVIAGPTYDGDIEPFEFDKIDICKNTSHYGVPNRPEFQWFEYVNQFDLN